MNRIEQIGHSMKEGFSSIKDALRRNLLKITSGLVIAGILTACIPSTVEGKTPTKTPTPTRTPTSLVLKATPTPTTETSTNKGITETAETKEVDALRDTVANAIIKFSSNRELKYKYIPKENNMYIDLSSLQRSTFDIQAQSKSIYFTATGLVLDGNTYGDWGWGSEYSARENARAQSIIDGTENLYEFVEKNADILSKYYKFDFEPGENGIKMVTIDVVGTIPSGGMETIAKYLLATTLDPKEWSIVKTVANDLIEEVVAVYLFDTTDNTLLLIQLGNSYEPKEIVTYGTSAGSSTLNILAPQVNDNGGWIIQTDGSYSPQPTDQAYIDEFKSLRGNQKRTLKFDKKGQLTL